ncbi:MAG: DNA repair protein RecN, partial [Sphingomonadales bacterium]
ALRRLERLPVELATRLKPALDALEAAANGAEEGLGALHKTHEGLNFDADALDQTEERLFGLRALARKHKCQVNDLPALQKTLKIKLAALEQGGQFLKTLEEKVLRKRAAFEKAARLLSRARKKAAKALEAGVGGELGPLKLEKARFRAAIKPLAVENWGPKGSERVEFEISTNPGAPFAPLLKIASGGELARFILALKVVLVRAGSAPCLVFDEVDSGVGGAVADAVGDRLGRLAVGAQVLVVTHSPQVAARASTHWRVDKEDREGGTVTTINILDESARREEIARMLSGASVTDKARAAAGSLIAGAE